MSYHFTVKYAFCMLQAIIFVSLVAYDIPEKHYPHFIEKKLRCRTVQWFVESIRVGIWPMLIWFYSLCFPSNHFPWNLVVYLKGRVAVWKGWWKREAAILGVGPELHNQDLSAWNSIPVSHVGIRGIHIWEYSAVFLGTCEGAGSGAEQPEVKQLLPHKVAITSLTQCVTMPTPTTLYCFHKHEQVSLQQQIIWTWLPNKKEYLINHVY